MGVRTRTTLVGFFSRLVAVVAGCTTSTSGSPSPDTLAPVASDGATMDGSQRTDWAPDPVELDGLTAVAAVDGTTFAVHTKSGEKTFLPGVNLGSTTPLHQPGELAITAADYERWFEEMGTSGSGRSGCTPSTRRPCMTSWRPTTRHTRPHRSISSRALGSLCDVD
jgi:hypothetical protein